MTFVRDMDTALEALREQITALEKKAAAVIEPLKKYEPYPDVKEYIWSAFHSGGSFKHGIDLRDEYFFRSNHGFMSPSLDNLTKEGLDKGLSHFQATYDKWKADCAPVVEKNKAIKEHNDLQTERVKAIMNTLGVVDKYSTFEYKTSRSSKKTEKRHTAGYLSDLSRITPTDQYSAICKRIESKYEQIKRFGEAKLKEATAARAAKEREQKEERQRREFALLQAKYTPDTADSDISEIIDVILSKNKYLRLAYWLEKNRGSWLDGYDYAETGIDGFVVETEMDREIEKELSDIVYDENPDIDGRAFRDCVWNYGVLYAMVEDEQLMKDLEKAQEIEE